MNKTDIRNRDDLVILLTAFYEKAVHDDIIGHFFTEVVPLDMKTHIPVIADFWETILLNGRSYQKNAMLPHDRINRLRHMEEKHFNRWLELFNATVDALFTGETASLAKQRALSIATVMRIRFSGSSPINIIK
jgi:hemoglobin